jgi:hypothetical protein
MFAANDVWKFLAQVLVYSGGGAMVVYLLFQYLGKTWIENKFAQRLEQLRYQQALELQRLRVEIDSLLSGALKLQEREFVVLPEAWAKLHDAHGLVAWLVSPMQQYVDVDRMNSAQLEEFLTGTKFTESQKDEVRKSHEKGCTYQEIIFWHRLQEVKTAFGDLQGFVARNGIFLPPGLKEKFVKISEILWSAIVSKEVGHEARDWKMQSEGWKKISEETDPMYKSIEADIQARLQSHGRKP